MKHSWIKKLIYRLRSKDGSMVMLFLSTLAIHQWVGPSSDSIAAPSKILTTKKNSNVLNSKKKTVASTPTPTNSPTPPPGSCSDCTCHLSSGPGGICEALEFGFQCRVYTDTDGFGCGRDTMAVVGCCTPTDTPTPTPTVTPTNTPTPACPNWNGSVWALGNAQYFHNAPATCAHPTVNVCFSTNPCLTPEITWPMSGSLPICNSPADNGNTTMVSPRCPQYQGPDWGSLTATQKTDCCTGGPTNTPTPTPVTTSTPTPTHTPTPTTPAFDCTTLNSQPFSSFFHSGDEAILHAPGGPNTFNGNFYAEGEHGCYCRYNGTGEQFYCTDQATGECGFKNWVMEGMSGSPPRIVSGGPVPPGSIVYQSILDGCGVPNTQCKYQVGTYADCGPHAPTCCPATGAWTTNCTATCPGPGSGGGCAPTDLQCY